MIAHRRAHRNRLQRPIPNLQLPGRLGDWHLGVGSSQLMRAVLVAALLASPLSIAWAQNVGLSSVTRYAGRLVWVQDRTGSQLLARVVSATNAELTVTLGGVARTFAVPDIVRVSLDGDSLTNGMIIGGAIGVPAGAFSCQGSVTEDCNFLGRALLGAVIYGAIGAWIDSRHHGRTVIYRAPRP